MQGQRGGIEIGNVNLRSDLYLKFAMEFRGKMKIIDNSSTEKEMDKSSESRR